MKYNSATSVIMKIFKAIKTNAYDIYEIKQNTEL